MPLVCRLLATCVIHLARGLALFSGSLNDVNWLTARPHERFSVECSLFASQNTCDPKWGEPFSFKIPGSSLVDAQLFLRVMGKQKLRDDISLGHVKLPLAGITNASEGVGVPGGRWFPLADGQGRLRIDAELLTRRPSLVV